MKNYFHILGLPIDATDADIRRAYRLLAKQYHPDVNTNEEAHSFFIQIKEAYEVLCEPTRKARHIQQLQYRATAKTSAYSQAARERVYEEWVHLQHREELKRKVAEMRRKQREEEESKNFVWYYFAVFKIFLYLLAGIALLTMTIAPLLLYLYNPEVKKEAGIKLILASIMGATFLSYFVYYSFIAERKRS